MKRIRLAIAATGIALVSGASVGATTVPDETAPGSTGTASAGGAGFGELRLIGEQQISNLTMVGGTLVGGLSGIDYDESSDAYVIISDDRSDNNPARYYDATLTFDDASFEAVEITSAHALVQLDGTTYPNQTQAEAGKSGAVPDPEALRLDPNDGSLWWTSEGSQVLGLPPVLTHADATGRALAVAVLPEMLPQRPTRKPRAFGTTRRPKA